LIRPFVKRAAGDKHFLYIKSKKPKKSKKIVQKIILKKIGNCSVHYQTASQEIVFKLHDNFFSS